MSSDNNNIEQEEMTSTNGAPETTIASQASLPQASFTSEQLQTPKKGQSLKIKFTLSTLSRKSDDDESEKGSSSSQRNESGDEEGTEEGRVALYDASSEAPSNTVSMDHEGFNSGKDDVDMESNQNEDATMEENEDDSMESSSEAMKANGLNDSNENDTIDTGVNEDDKEELGDRDSRGEDDTKDDDGDNAPAAEVYSRPSRTRASYEKDLNNDRDSAKNGDGKGKGDGSLDENVRSNNNAGYVTSRSGLTAAEIEMLGFREPATTSTNLTTSFLDALSEDQRRMRVRYLPNVTGFRRLHKGEIKRDVALVKKMLKNAMSKADGRYETTDEGSTNEVENMETDENGTNASGDETQSDEEAVNTLSPDNETFDEANPELYNVFSLPYIQSPYICTDVENKYSNQHSEEPALFSSPQVVESITVYNPMRPPESVGPKKMHRLQRWEQNPEQVEVDLSNYRKTVNRTRQELHKAEMEREHIELIGAHLRSHFISQMQCMREEMKILSQQYDATQTKCIKAADLLTSKTRSRGVARGSFVMKDIISVMKSRGEKLSVNSKDWSNINTEPWCVSGMGGVAYEDATSMLGSGWLLPGDKVSSPYGVGIVDKVFGQSLQDKNSKEILQSNLKPPQSQVHPSNDTKKDNSLSPRVRVKLPFGDGYFNPSSLVLIDSSTSFCDNELASRWIAMLESAKMMGTVADSLAVDNNNFNIRDSSNSKDNEADNIDEDNLTESSQVPDVENTAMNVNDSTIPTEINSSRKPKMVSFDAGILPLGHNIGANIDISQMENHVEQLLKGSRGVVGVVSIYIFTMLPQFIKTTLKIIILNLLQNTQRNNPSVPTGYRNWESNREELRILEGEAMQLRNKVYRQKRARYLNERSCNSNKDRTDRFELLLTEMKADLNILKKRLNAELLELG